MESILDEQYRYLERQATISSTPICSICLEDLIAIDETTLAEKELARFTGCGHTFHMHCIHAAIGPIPRTGKPYPLFRASRPCVKCASCGASHCSKTCGGQQCNPLKRVYLTTEAPSPTSVIPLILKVNGEVVERINLAAVAQKLAMDVEGLVGELRGRDQYFVMNGRDKWFEVEGPNLDALLGRFNALLDSLQQKRVDQGIHSCVQDAGKAIIAVASTLSTQELITRDHAIHANLVRSIAEQKKLLKQSTSENKILQETNESIRAAIREEERSKLLTWLKAQENRSAALETRNTFLENERQTYTAIKARNEELETINRNSERNVSDLREESSNWKRRYGQLESEMRSMRVKKSQAQLQAGQDSTTPYGNAVNPSLLQPHTANITTAGIRPGACGMPRNTKLRSRLMHVPPSKHSVNPHLPESILEFLPPLPFGSAQTIDATLQPNGYQDLSSPAQAATYAGYPPGASPIKDKADGYWTCGTCTFVSEGARNRCEVCDALRLMEYEVDEDSSGQVDGR